MDPEENKGGQSQLLTLLCRWMDINPIQSPKKKTCLRGNQNVEAIDKSRP